MKHGSLRVQITLAVGMIVTLACLILTVNSIYSANSYYVPYLADEAIPDSTVSNQTEHFDENTMKPDTPEDLSRGFLVRGLGVMAGAIIGSILFTWWVTGLLLRPLENLTESIKSIDHGKLNQPLPEPEGAAEVRQLTKSFNGMLGRLNNAFQIQKRFAADAAHELKTPLTVIKTSFQVLQMDDHPSIEEYEEFVKDTGESVELLIETVEGLLALAGGPTRKTQEAVALKELCENVIKELNAKAQERGVFPRINGEELSVTGNRTLFYRAIYNVVDNAIKYNHRGGYVEITLKPKEGQAVVEIADNGIGIPADSMADIFQPFYRADPSRSKAIEGSGLGLAVTQKIMDEYHGKIFVKSNPDEGTTVTLCFPTN